MRSVEGRGSSRERVPPSGSAGCARVRRTPRVTALCTLLAGALVLALLLPGCARGPSSASPPSSPASSGSSPSASSPTGPSPAPPSSPDVILATTTSTQDTGLLDVLVPRFEQKTGYKVKVIAVGTGQALAMAREGNADVVLVHSPAAEKEAVAQGYCVDRRLVMHNDFVIVGPSPDPARIKGQESAVEAFRTIAAAKAPFVSRGDDSGTHKMELSLWKQAGLTPSPDGWYIEAGSGMGVTLNLASERGAYTLTDRGTFLAQRKNLALEVMVEGDPVLLNIYHVMVVNPEKFPRVNAEGARAFADFLVSPEVQEIIGRFGLEEYGEPLFVPDAGKSEEELGG